ncbi:hypothetical protein ALP03_00721 [Pseudomonas amygdali pv. tabaci]|uniref:Uncharacterized protein n=1 Tax=Pseudomonas amygdali pv. tabaci TaxID=322 RepID=A0A3M6H9V2_PSEAJ|nr:hypothetical protein ALP03_00721 [Pseudomonas amygdali pv. tabaci]
MRARIAQTIVSSAGTSRVSHIGAVAQWVNANAQVLTSSTKYINGSCRDNATYWACNSLGLSAGTDITVRKALTSFFSIARLLCHYSQSTRGLLLIM